MPTYEYKCSACGHAFERFQSMTAEPVKRCPECGKAKVKRLISTGAGLIFKGSGFYITDYRDAGYKEKAKAESGSTASGDGKAETKTESKSGGEGGASATPAAETTPAAKSESKPAPKSEGKSSRKKDRS